MNIPEHYHLQAELTTLEGLLERLPAQNVIERNSLEFRKKEVEEALASLPEKENTPSGIRRIVALDPSGPRG